MADILAFPSKAPAPEITPDETPKYRGEAFCIQCNTEWTAVVPVGLTQLQCPSCRTMKGLLRYPFAPEPDVLIRECGCGNVFFWVTPDGHMCPNCGILQSY